jgi:outer membrane protein insertion porin family
VEDGTIGSAVSLREGRVLRTTDLAASQRSLYESNLFHEARVTVPPQADSAKRVRIEVREAPLRAARLGGGFNTVEFAQAEARYTHYNWMGGGRRLDLRFTLGNLLARQLNDRGIFRDVTPPTPNAADADAFLTPTWIASADLVQPAFRSSLNTAGFSVFAHRRTVPAVAIDRGFGGELSITRRIDRNIPATISYRYERSAVDGGDLYFCVNYAICDPPTVDALRTANTMAPLRFAAFTNRSDDPLAPTQGYRARLDLEHASQLTVSDFRYQRASSAATYYHPLGFRRNRVLAGRLRAGWVRPLSGTASALGVGNDGEGAELALLHPRKRFYAGGSRSVRGYAENELGPRILTVDPAALRNGGDENGCEPGTPISECDPNAPGIDPLAFRARPLGGTSLLEASVEYRFPLWGPLQGAVFVDGAVVGQSLDALISEGTAAVTPGFGARLPTPVGPIRVDLGVRPRIRERLPVVTESEDEFGERTLVTLDQLRDYDPLEGRGGGFLGQVLGRLTLHLSIGEAF